MTPKALLILLALSTFSSVLGQTCDPSLTRKAVDGRYGYRSRSGDARCEGIFQQAVAGEELEIVSFTKGPLNYSLSNDELRIKTYPMESTSALNVRGVNFGMGRSYRLDMLVPAGSNRIVPVDEVLGPNQIDPVHFGIVAFFENKTSKRTLVPLEISSKSFQSTRKSSFQLVFVSNVELTKIAWRYASSSDAICGAFGGYVERTGNFVRSTPIRIELPQEMNTGEYCLDIKALTYDGHWIGRSVNLILP